MSIFNVHFSGITIFTPVLVCISAKIIRNSICCLVFLLTVLLTEYYLRKAEKIARFFLCITKSNQSRNEYKRPRWHFALGAYVAVATKPVHRLQICPIVHNYGALSTISSKLHPGACSSVEMRRGTDRQTHANTDRHTDGRGHKTFRLAMSNAKWNNHFILLFCPHTKDQGTDFMCMYKRER